MIVGGGKTGADAILRLLRGKGNRDGMATGTPKRGGMYADVRAAQTAKDGTVSSVVQSAAGD